MYIFACFRFSFDSFLFVLTRYIFLGITCEEYGKKLAKEGRAQPDAGIPFDTDLIKCCPMCGVPIEKDEGCAQMMCKRCKHVFCWYCLASLDVSLYNNF